MSIKYACNAHFHLAIPLPSPPHSSGLIPTAAGCCAVLPGEQRQGHHLPYTCYGREPSPCHHTLGEDPDEGRHVPSESLVSGISLLTLLSSITTPLTDSQDISVLFSVVCLWCHHSFINGYQQLCIFYFCGHAFNVMFWWWLILSTLSALVK